MLETVLIWLAVGFAVGAAFWLIRGQLRRREARERLLSVEVDSLEEGTEGSVRRWLYIAGYRRPDATSIFWTTQIVAVVIGVVAAIVLSTSGVVEEASRAAEGVSGGIGGAVGPIFDIAGALIVLVLAGLPLVWVRRRRRQRVDAIESDLPVALELMASLARSGQGFDAAIARILDAERGGEDRPLATELGLYRSDILSGVPREESFQRLGERASVPSLDVFVAAMTHSERLGVGLSDTLRRQADELWSQRRERALARAQTLPAKLAGPLIACFLPGLLLVSLGPALVRFWETISGITQGIN